MSDFETVQPTEVPEGAQLIDVREADEFAEWHAKGATNLPLSELQVRYGELDLVAADGSVLVIVEVKTRASRTYDDPVMAVTPTKLARMRRLAGMWLAAQDRRWSQIRFDVVSVRLDQAAPDDLARAQVRHHQGVHV